MPRTCTVCGHPQRPEIDQALASESASNRRIAAHYGVTEQSVRRHKADHVPAALAKAKAARDVVQGDTLLDRLRLINAETADVLTLAKSEQDHDLRLRAIARAERQIELEARLLGELTESATINITIAPQWLVARTIILTALQDYPDARVAVAEALMAIGAACRCVARHRGPLRASPAILPVPSIRWSSPTGPA